MERILRNISEEIYNETGGGYSEACYHRCMELELQMCNVKYSTEVGLPIKYKGCYVAFCRIDLLLYEDNKEIIVELKAIPMVTYKEKEQLRRYMRNLKNCADVGYLINFSKNKLEFFAITL
jgi:GxxExxY protein